MSSKKSGDDMWFTTAIVQLPLIRQIAGVHVNKPSEIFKQCEDISHMTQESFHVLALNRRNRMVGRMMVTLGIVDSCLVHPREVFRGAIMINACAIVLVHNHPSGDTSPSAEDVRITNQLIDAGKIVDIKVMDHVIIGPEVEGVTTPRYFSFRESGLCQF